MRLKLPNPPDPKDFFRQKLMFEVHLALKDKFEHKIDSFEDSAGNLFLESKTLDITYHTISDSIEFIARQMGREGNLAGEALLFSLELK